jgi:hypothetical protein
MRLAVERGGFAEVTPQIGVDMPGAGLGQDASRSRRRCRRAYSRKRDGRRTAGPVRFGDDVELHLRRAAIDRGGRAGQQVLAPLARQLIGVADRGIGAEGGHREFGMTLAWVDSEQARSQNGMRGVFET